MGIPKKSLYVIDTGDENCLLLSAFKPQRNKDGVWGYTLDTPLSLNMWILKTSFPDYTPGIVWRLRWIFLKKKLVYM